MEQSELSAIGRSAKRAVILSVKRTEDIVEAVVDACSDVMVTTLAGAGNIDSNSKPL